jgi:hypothetical protein
LEGNTAPLFLNNLVSINSTTGTNKTLEDLNCFATLSDNENNTLNVSARWYKNDVSQFTLEYNNSYTNGTLFISILDDENTTKGENWSCALRVCDSGLCSEWNQSSNLTVLNTAPTASLVAPNDNNSSTNRNPTFIWNGTDADNDTLSYNINVSLVASSICVDSEKYQTTSDENYTVFLKCLYDHLDYYSWKVRAYDGSDYGSWTSARNLYINSLVSISLPVNLTNFGQLSNGESVNTTTDSPLPLRVNNTGNVLENITILATPLWVSEGAPNNYYQFRIDNRTSGSGIFDLVGTLTAWGQMPIVELVGISRLNYTKTADVDLYIEVPMTEGAGVKRSIINFTVYLAE